MKILTLISFVFLSVSALPSSRIWNGNAARPHQAPYMIGILWYEFETTVQPMNICGGAIINQWWVITAAHCLDNNLTGIGRFQIVVGQHFVSIGNRSGREQFGEIALEIWHPNYAGGASAYDIALVRIDRPLQFNEFVQPIALPVQSTQFPQSGRVTSFGWGIITERPPGVLPDELQTTELQIFPSDLCREVINSLLPVNTFSSSCLCTRMINSASGNVCNADSGGPAVMTNSNGEKVLVGVLAWGIGPCSNVDHPAVWSTIATARNWIDSTIAANPPN